MLPPETMHTILPSPARPGERRRHGKGSRALRDHAGALGQGSHRRGSLVERQRDAAGEQPVSPVPHRAEQHLAARPVDE